MLFENALSQIFAGIYVLEVTLIGLFFLVRDSKGRVACTPQAVIMIIALIFTAIYHYVLETTLRPLHDFLPATLEDAAVAAERERFRVDSDIAQTYKREEHVRQSDSIELSKPSSDSEKPNAAETSESRLDTQVDRTTSRAQTKGISKTAANARKALFRLNKETAARRASNQAHTHTRAGTSRRREVADQMGASIAGYPDELTDLTPQELEAELKAAYQDPVTRVPPPVIWIPKDPAGVSEDTVKRAARYGNYLQYSNSGAFLTKKNKVEVTQPAPDARPDWLLDWEL